MVELWPSKPLTEVRFLLLSKMALPRKKRIIKKKYFYTRSKNVMNQFFIKKNLFISNEVAPLRTKQFNYFQIPSLDVFFTELTVKSSFLSSANCLQVYAHHNF